MKEMPPISCCPGTRAGGFAALGIALAVLIITSDKANARSSSSEGAEVDGKPSQVHLTLTPNDDEMIVWWTTQRKTGPSTVQYGTSENNLDNTEVVHDEPTYYEEPWKPFGQYRSNYIHEVTLKRLWLGGSRYYYRCGDPQGGWSPIYSFVTRKGPDQPIRLAVFADQGTVDRKYRGSQVVADVLGKLSRYDLWLHLGDMSYADGNQPEWDVYGEQIERYTARLPGAVAVGNHEREGNAMLFDAFLARWRNGEHGKGADAFYWSFNYGPMHIVVLTSEHDDRSQSEWLEKDLEKANRPEELLYRPWIMVLIHRPIFADKRKYLGRSADRDGIRKAIEKHGATFALSGHCHNYERMWPYNFWSETVTHKEDGQGSRPYITMTYDKADEAPEQSNTDRQSSSYGGEDVKATGGKLGTIQLTLGTAGHGTFTPCKRQSGLTIGDTMNVFGFGQFEANRRQLRFQFIDQNGKVLDEFQMCSRPRCAPPPSLGASAPQGNASQARGPPPPPSPPPPPPLKTPPPPKPTSPPRPAPLTPPPSPPLRSPPATAPAKATPNGSQPVTAPQTSSVPSPSPQAPSWAWIWKPAQETKAQKNEALPTSAAAKHSPAVSPPPPVWTWEPKEPAGSQEKQALSPKETEQGPPPLLPSDTRQTNASSSPPPPPAGWAWTWKPGTARLGQQPSAPSKGPPKPDKEPASQAEPEPANRDRGVGANLPNGAGATTDAMPVGQVQPETPAGKSSSTAPQANRRQPSEPTANQEREEPGRARPLDTEADMTFAIEFPSLDISEFADSAFDGEFRGKYEQEIKNSLDCGGDCTAHVGRISAGSVVVETSVFYLEGSAAEIAKALEDLETHLTHKPGSLFSSAFLAEFDHPSKVRIIRTKLGQARAADEPGAGNMPASGNAASGVPAREGQAEGELPANGGFHSTDVADAPYAPVDDRAEAVDPADGWFGDDFDDWFVEEEYEEEVADVARNEGVWPVAWMERMNGTMSSITENSDPRQEGPNDMDARDAVEPLAWIVGGVLMILALIVAGLCARYGFCSRKPQAKMAGLHTAKRRRDASSNASESSEGDGAKSSEKKAALSQSAFENDYAAWEGEIQPSASLQGVPDIQAAEPLSPVHMELSTDFCCPVPIEVDKAGTQL